MARVSTLPWRDECSCVEELGSCVRTSRIPARPAAVTRYHGDPYFLRLFAGRVGFLLLIFTASSGLSFSLGLSVNVTVCVRSAS